MKKGSEGSSKRSDSGRNSIGSRSHGSRSRGSHASKHTGGTGTYLSSNMSTKMSFDKVFTNVFSGVSINLSERRFYGEKFWLVVFELWNIMMMIGYSMIHVLLPIVQKYFTNMKLLPLIFVDNGTVEIVVFVIAALIAGLGIILFFYSYYTGNSNDVYCKFFAFYLRLLRSVLFYPVIICLTFTIRCDYFNGSFLLYNKEDTKCITYPYILSLVVGCVLTILLYLITSMDCILILDKFKSLDYLTSSPDGRFNFLVHTNNFLLVIISQVFYYHDRFFIILPIYAILSFTVLLVIAIRFIPFYSKTMVCLYVVAFSLTLGNYLGSLFTSIFKSFITLNTLFAGVGIALAAVIFLVIRYKFISRYFSIEKGITRNFLFCFYPSDISLYLYFIKGDSQDATKKMITNLIKDKDIRKSKSICHQLIPMIILVDYRLATSILKHARGILKRDWFDSEFFLKYYRNKIFEIQNIGRKGSPKTVRDLHLTRKREDKLRDLYKKLFNVLLSDSSYKQYPQLISEIYQNKEYCRKIYEKLITQNPSVKTYRSYAKYLIDYENNLQIADIFLKEAENLESKETTFEDLSEDDNEGEFSKVVPHAEFSRKASSVKKEGKSSAVNVSSPLIPMYQKDNFFSSPGARSIGNRRKSNSTIGGVSVARNKFNNKGDSLQNYSMNVLRKKAHSTKFLSNMLIKYSVLGLFVICFICIIVTFVLVMAMKSLFDKGLAISDSGNNVRRECMRFPLLTRKMQISRFDETVFERNTSAFRENLKLSCEKIREDLHFVYRTDSSVLNSITIPFIETHDDGDVHKRNYTLIDAINMFSTRCELMYKLPDEELPMMINGTVEYNADFMFLFNNAEMLHETLEVEFENFVVMQAELSSRYFTVFFIPPIAIIPIFLLLIFLYVVYSIQQKRTIKGFSLIPKSNLFDIYKKFGGNLDETDVKVDISRFSLIQKFFVTSFCLLFFVFVVVGLLSLFGILSLKKYASSSKLLYQIKHFQSDIHLLHLFATELIYPESSLFEQEYVIHTIEETVEEISAEYDILRYGSKKEGIPMTDVEYYMEYYIDSCDPSLKNNVFEKLSCYSFTHQLNLFYSKLEHVIEQVSNSSEDEHDEHGHRRKVNFHDDNLLSSLVWEEIINMDNNILNRGTIHDQFVSLEGKMSQSVLDFMNIFQNLSIVLLFLVIPIFLVVWCLILYPFIANLQKNLLEPKNILLLLPMEALMEKNLYDYLSDKLTIANTLRRESSRRKNQIFEILNMSGYYCLVFDVKLRILSYNEKAEKLFKFKKEDVGNPLSGYIDEDPIKKIKKWLKQPVKLALNVQITLTNKRNQKIYDCDISRDKKTVLMMFKDSQKGSSSGGQIHRLMALMFPEDVLKRVSCYQNFQDEINFVEEYKDCTAFFGDIANFTKITHMMKGEELIELLNELFWVLDDLCVQFDIEKIKTIGDCYFCVSGVPQYNPFHCQNMMKFAVAVLHFLRSFNEKNEVDLHLRIGISSGKVIGGCVGKIKFQYDCWGETINMAARMETNGLPDKIQVSQSSYDILRETYDFYDRKISVQGIGVVPAFVYSPKDEDIENILREEMETPTKQKLVGSVKGEQSIFDIKKGENAAADSKSFETSVSEEKKEKKMKKKKKKETQKVDEKTKDKETDDNNPHENVSPVRKLKVQSKMNMLSQYPESPIKGLLRKSIKDTKRDCEDDLFVDDV